MLSTIPFIALIAALGVLSIAIMISAWPWHEQPSQAKGPPAHEVGVAPKGWFQEAQKEMR